MGMSVSANHSQGLGQKMKGAEPVTSDATPTLSLSAQPSN